MAEAEYSIRRGLTEGQTKDWAKALLFGNPTGLLNRDDVLELIRQENERSVLRLTDLQGQIDFSADDLYLAEALCEVFEGEDGLLQYKALVAEVMVYHSRGIDFKVSIIPCTDEAGAVGLAYRVVPYLPENTTSEVRARLEILAHTEAGKVIREESLSVSSPINIHSFDLPRARFN